MFSGESVCAWPIVRPPRSRMRGDPALSPVGDWDQCAVGIWIQWKPAYPILTSLTALADATCARFNWRLSKWRSLDSDPDGVRLAPPLYVGLCGSRLAPWLPRSDTCVFDESWKSRRTSAFLSMCTSATSWLNAGYGVE